MIENNRRLHYSRLRSVADIVHLVYCFRTKAATEKGKTSITLSFKHWQDANWAIDHGFIYDGEVHTIGIYNQDRKLQQCFTCWGFEHIENRCIATIKCGRCTGDHGTKDCQSAVKKSSNCNDNHVVDSLDCRHILAANQKRIAVSLASKSVRYEDPDKQAVPSTHSIVPTLFGSSNPSSEGPQDSPWDGPQETAQENISAAEKILSSNTTLIELKSPAAPLISLAMVSAIPTGPATPPQNAGMGEMMSILETFAGTILEGTQRQNERVIQTMKGFNIQTTSHFHSNKFT